MNARIFPLAAMTAGILLVGAAQANNEATNTNPAIDSTGVDRARISAGTQMNPTISVILDGVYANFSREVEGPAGFGSHDHGDDHDHEHEHGLEEGFSLRETEISVSASIDNYLDGVMTLAIEGNSGIKVEEAYILTRSLPAGLQIKAGRFLSDIGYINRQHPHDWQFADRPLVSELLFGEHGLQDNGMQLSWLPSTSFYSRYGIEILQGETTMASQDVHETLEEDHGPRLYTAFAKFAPDLGMNHAAMFGFSGGISTSFKKEEEHDDEVELWEGDGWFAGIDAVYKYNSGKPFGHGNWIVQGEYYFREISAEFTEIENQIIEEQFSGRSKQDGFYLQALYGFAPRWSTGLRVDGVGLTNTSLEPGNDAFESFDASYRYAAQVSFAPTEFSRLRLQVNNYDYAHDDGDHGHDAWGVMLQYNVSLGAHGAHQF
ncbi:MAG: zinc-regulated TonB-dependent outer membrane receptor [Gammaproteobacteria bacterium HGW-Gammaproteobacteria-14]|nr:MAG: zinc-regulated TonB-dependent outer membrane receptor [Gammaproteobacteria bacterium HGW-Gammaproteobacteria-14]